MSIKVYSPLEEISFGKYKGSGIIRIYKYDPNYLIWAVRSVDTFAINLDAFKLLPPPTPVVTSKGYDAAFLKLLFDKQGIPNREFNWMPPTGNELFLLIEEFIEFRKYSPKESPFVLSELDKNTNVNKAIRSTIVFRSSGHKYGQTYNQHGGPSDGYGGNLSDDFINDALGGDADAYWNID